MMSVYESIVKFITSKENDKNDALKAPEGVCPNCWGRQEYGGQFFEVMENKNVDINKTEESKGWIQDYADKHLAGIVLKKENDHLVCSKCKLTYAIEK